MSVSQSHFRRLSKPFKKKIVSMWFERCGCSYEEGILMLIDRAKSLKLIKPSFNCEDLSSISIEHEMYLWPFVSAFSFLLEDGWCPSNDNEWATFAELFRREIDSTDLDTLKSKLPQHIDQNIAAGWLLAAIEEYINYKHRNGRSKK